MVGLQRLATLIRRKPPEEKHSPRQPRPAAPPRAEPEPLRPRYAAVDPRERDVSELLNWIR